MNILKGVAICAGITCSIAFGVMYLFGPAEDTNVEGQISAELEAIERRDTEVQKKQSELDAMSVFLDSLETYPAGEYRSSRVRLIRIKAEQFVRFGREVQRLDSISFAKIDSLENLID